MNVDARIHAAVMETAKPVRSITEKTAQGQIAACPQKTENLVINRFFQLFPKPGYF